LNTPKNQKSEGVAQKPRTLRTSGIGKGTARSDFMLWEEEFMDKKNKNYMGATSDLTLNLTTKQDDPNGE